LEELPYEILQSMIQCFGRAFHYKDNMTAFLLSCGVPQVQAQKHRDSAKFVWARNLLSELDQTENGRLIIRRILTKLCHLKQIPDENVPSKDEAIKALRNLKQLAYDQALVAKQERSTEKARTSDSQMRAELLKERARYLEELRDRFSKAVTNPNRQQSGFDLEDLLADIFQHFEIEYRPSYRTPTQQIDGHFSFDSFDYIVEARWRKQQPTEADIAGLKQKVETKLESTRGLFFNIDGFRPEVVEAFSGKKSNIILMDGSHLIHVLEGRSDLRDILRRIIRNAAQEGRVYTPISDI
jgi:hypothetical protein